MLLTRPDNTLSRRKHQRDLRQNGSGRLRAAQGFPRVLMKAMIRAVLIDHQTDNCQSSLEKSCSISVDPLEGVDILQPPIDADTGEHRPHFGHSIVLGPLEDNRPPINIFIQGTSSRGILIRMYNLSFLPS